MPPRFTPVQSQGTQPGGSRFTRVAQGTSLGPALGAARAGLGLGNLVGNLSGTMTPGLGLGAGLAQTGLGLMQAGESFAQGRPVPGTLGTLGAVGGGLNVAATAYPGLDTTLGGGLKLASQGLGTAAGLGSGAYSISQGNEEAGAMQIAQTLAQLAAPQLAIPGAIGKAVELGVNFGLGEGPFGQTRLPFGRNNRFSSADNLASQLSKMTGITGGNILLDAVQKAKDPMALLAMALAGPQLSPHGEIQFYHPQLGFGGDWDDPQSATFQAAVQQIAKTGDPDLLRQFIGGVNIQTGESGATRVDPILTDWYRRKLVSLIPETHPVRQNLTGLFGPPIGYYATGHEALASPLFRTQPEIDELEGQRVWALGQQGGFGRPLTPEEQFTQNYPGFSNMYPSL